MVSKELTESEKSELIEMALSDSISFRNIFDQFGLKEKETKKFTFLLISFLIFG